MNHDIVSATKQIHDYIVDLLKTQKKKKIKSTEINDGWMNRRSNTC